MARIQKLLISEEQAKEIILEFMNGKAMADLAIACSEKIARSQEIEVDQLAVFREIGRILNAEVPTGRSAYIGLFSTPAIARVKHAKALARMEWPQLCDQCGSANILNRNGTGLLWLCRSCDRRWGIRLAQPEDLLDDHCM